MGICVPEGLRAVAHAGLEACGNFCCCPEREPCEDRLCWLAYLLKPHWFEQVIILLIASRGVIFLARRNPVVAR